MTQGERIVEEAKSWLGTPYVSGGKVKGAGADCGMLLLGVLENLGLVKDFDVKPYSNEWHLHHSEEKLLKYVLKACYKVKELKLGDFILYQYGRCISHAAIYIGGGLVIHSYIDMGVIISEYEDVIFYDKKGRSRIRGVYRFGKVGGYGDI